jgi:hypothetical protein
MSLLETAALVSVVADAVADVEMTHERIDGEHLTAVQSPLPPCDSIVAAPPTTNKTRSSASKIYW